MKTHTNNSKIVSINIRSNGYSTAARSRYNRTYGILVVVVSKQADIKTQKNENQTLPSLAMRHDITCVVDKQVKKANFNKQQSEATFPIHPESRSLFSVLDPFSLLLENYITIFDSFDLSLIEYSVDELFYCSSVVCRRLFLVRT